MQLRGFRLWLVAFAVFFLMIAAWAFAAPYDAMPDEHDHVYRAVGVAGGEIAPEPVDAVRGSGAFQTVPRGLVRPDQCWHVQTRVSAACATEPSSDRTPVRVATGAGRYHPAYYAMVGLPLKLWPGWAGIYGARLLSGAACAALLAAALATIVRYSRRRLMLAGLLVAMTPMAVHLFGAVNPNALEIAAGVGFFTAVIPLVLGRVDGVPRGLLALAGISAVALASLRPTGLIYLAAGLVAVLVPVRRAVLARLWGSLAVRWWTGAVAGAVVIAVAWAVLMKSANLGTVFRSGPEYELGQAAFFVLSQWEVWTHELIGVFSWLDTSLPAPAYLLWEFAAGALLVGAVAFGGLVDRWRLFCVFGGAVVVPTTMQIVFLNDTGWVTQGRYVLPALVGLVLLAAFVLEERGMPAPAGRSMTRLFLGVLLPIQVFSLLWTQTRWRWGLPPYGDVGPSTLNPFNPGWRPPVGAGTPLVLMLLGAAGLAWLIWRASAGTGPAAVGTAPDGVAPDATPDVEASDDDPPAAAPAGPDTGPADRPAVVPVSTDAASIEAVPGSNR